MATRTFKVSDLTGDVIQDDRDVVTLVIHDHPLIEHPVQLDADQAEVSELEGSSKDVAVIELVSDGGDKRKRLVLDLAEFDKLFRTDVDDALKNADPYRESDRPAPGGEAPRRRGRPRGSGPAAAKSERTDYTVAENIGLIHRGRITDREKELVATNFEKAQENRRREGQAEIDLTNAKDVAKYGLEELAKATSA